MPFLFQGPPPPPSGVVVTTYASNCTTPKNLFNVRDADLTVCAKVTGASPGTVIIWSNARFEGVQNTPLGTGESTFLLTTTSSLGDWRVIVYEPFGGSVYAATPFTVVDNDNPSADLNVFNGSSAASVAAGGQAVFTVQVSNLGPSTATAQLAQSIPANTTFASFALDSGPVGTSCSFPTVGSNSGTTNCTIPLAHGETAIFLAVYDVGAVSAGTIISSTATVNSTTTDPEDDNNSSSTEVTVSGNVTATCTLDCPANVVKTANTTQGGQSGAFVNYGAAAVTGGDCGTVSNSPASGSFFPVGTHSVTSSSQFGGASCNFTVTVLDSNPPTISCPPNVKVTAAEGATDATVNAGTPTINASGGGTVVGIRSDDVQAVYDDNGVLVTPPVVHPLNGSYPIGITDIAWTVTDAGGRTASCSQSVTVVAFADRDPVTISCPQPLTVTASSGCSTTISGATLGTPTTNYPGDSNVVVEADRSDGAALSDPFPAGITQITWTATDNTNGNTASCVQNVTVNPAGGADTTPPTLTVPANVVATTSSCTTILDDELGTAQASDTGACSGAVTIGRSGVPAGNVFPTGITTITYTATDAAGNTTTGTQTVTVTESPAVPPAISCPSDITVFLPINSTATSTVVNYIAPVGTDNCAGAVTTQIAGLLSGASFPVGTTTNRFRVTDKSGNFVECSFNVTVLYNFSGFFQPVDNLPIFNVVNAGKAIPVKFSLSGNKGLNIFGANSPFTVAINCDGSSPQDDIEETLNAGNSSLSYDAATDHYIYVWKTQNSWKNTCRQLILRLNDGTDHTANFKFK